MLSERLHCLLEVFPKPLGIFESGIETHEGPGSRWGFPSRDLIKTDGRDDERLMATPGDGHFKPAQTVYEVFHVSHLIGFELNGEQAPTTPHLFFREFVLGGIGQEREPHLCYFFVPGQDIGEESSILVASFHTKFEGTQTSNHEACVVSGQNAPEGHEFRFEYFSDHGFATAHYACDNVGVAIQVFGS